MNRLFLFFLFLGLLFSGCARDKELRPITQQQSATIESLNKEVDRLNQELQQAIQLREDLAKTKEALEKKLKGELEAGDMTVSMQERGLVVTVLDRVLFDSGKAELKTSSETTLEKIADVLKEKVHDHMVYVEGHTDNQPIRYSGWRSNWELSSARATEVIHYFVDTKGYLPERLAAVGYGEFHPVASNNTPQGRLVNRRVEIVISPKKFKAAGVPTAT